MCILAIAIFAWTWWDVFAVGFRRDHWWFLEEVKDLPQSAWDLISHTYSFSRSRTVLPQNLTEFRPLTHVVIALNHALFGFNAMAWSALSLFLHLLTSGVIFAFLRTGLKDTTSLGLALLFAVSFHGAELVSWTHMQGYQIFILLTLLSLHYWRRERPWLCFLALLLSAFFVEIGILTGPLFFFFSTPSQRRSFRWALFLPTLIFVSVSLADLRLWPMRGEPLDSNLFAWGRFPGNLWRALLMMVEYALLWIAPWLAHFRFPDWIGNAEMQFDRTQVTAALSGFIAGLIAFGIWIWRRRPTRSLPRHQSSLQAILWSLTGLFLAAIAWGRLDMPYLLYSRFHYAAFFSTLAMTAVALALGRWIDSERKQTRVVAWTIIAVLIGSHAFATHRHLHALRMHYEPLSQYLNSIRQFLKSHPTPERVQLVFPIESEAPQFERPAFHTIIADGKRHDSSPFTPARLEFKAYLRPAPLVYRVHVRGQTVTIEPQEGANPKAIK